MTGIEAAVHKAAAEARVRTVFLPASAELAEGLALFEPTIKGLAAQESVARSVDLQVRQWTTDAYGAGQHVQNVIFDSVQFDRVDLVVLVVWNRIGEGTRAEPDLAQQLHSQTGWPKLLVLAREPTRRYCSA